MSFTHLRVHVHEVAGTVILNRPEQRNALNRQLLRELRQALEDLHLQRSVRAVILTGSGSAFCAGMDLKEMLETAEQEDAQRLWHQDAELYREVLEQMLLFPKPIIAAVNGPAVAGGAGLVLASDVVLAAPEARFGLPEPLRGLVAGMVAPLLAFRIGAGHAARLLLTSEIVPAEEALRIGAFHRVVPEEQLWAAAVEVARQCARGAPEALQLSKRMLNETVGAQLSTLLATGAAISATARTTEAAQEGLRAFQEKRQPQWP